MYVYLQLNKKGRRSRVKNVTLYTPGYGTLSAIRSFIKELKPNSVMVAGSVSTVFIQSVDEIGFDMTTGGLECSVTVA